MRFRRGMRLLGSAALSLFLLTGASGCSSQQQDEEGLEVEQDGGGGENEAANNEEADQEGGGENQATDEGGEDQAAVEDNEGGEDNEMAEASGNGNATENDLQEIIQEMNGQQTAGADAGTGEPLQQAPEAMPANQAPVNTAAAPAPAPAAAPAAPESTALPFQPGGSPAAPGLPEIGSKMAYIVQHGDTLAKISAKIYGSGGRWNELATLSGIPNPSRIYPGDLVYYTLDESAIAFATAYETVQRQEEQVKPGDTLATIAQRVYGDSNAWRSIWRQNDKIDNPDIIPPGSTVYYVPKGALTAEVKKVRAVMAKRSETANSDVIVATTPKTSEQIVNTNSTETASNVSNTSTDTVDSNANVSTGIKLATLKLGYSIENVLGGHALAALN